MLIQFFKFLLLFYFWVQLLGISLGMHSVLYNQWYFKCIQIPQSVWLPPSAAWCTCVCVCVCKAVLRMLKSVPESTLAYLFYRIILFFLHSANFSHQPSTCRELTSPLALCSHFECLPVVPIAGTLLDTNGLEKGWSVSLLT